MTEAEKQSIVSEMTNLERSLLNLRETLSKKGSDASLQNREVLFRYAQLHALINLCDLLKIDRQEYNWIYNL